MFSGGIAAMGNTMFPPESLQEGLTDDFSPQAHPLIRLRILHPFLAIGVGVFLWMSHALTGWLKPTPQARRFRNLLLVVYAVQLLVGTVNLAMLGPIPLQLTASCTGRNGLRSMVRSRLVDSQLFPHRQRHTICILANERDPAFMINTTSTFPAATWRDYLTLTKPKVISLLLFTAVCPMFMAARGLPPWLPLLGVLVGGYMATGGAGVFNMVLDRDIDGKMRRTANRPLVTGVVTVRNAVVFGFLLSVGAFLVLWLTANLLTALLAWFGLLFYVIVYTAWLKRSTWQNIVIGGVAGSVMPLLGMGCRHQWT